jgi:hypothetical protein
VHHTVEPTVLGDARFDQTDDRVAVAHIGAVVVHLRAGVGCGLERRADLALGEQASHLRFDLGRGLRFRVLEQCLAQGTFVARTCQLRGFGFFGKR